MALLAAGHAGATPATIVVGDVVGLAQSERASAHVPIPLTLPAQLREWLEVA